MTRRPLVFVAVLLVTGIVAPVRPFQAQPGAQPPNEPADISVDGGRVLVRYHGAAIFEGRIANPDALRSATINAFNRDGAVDQVVALTARSSREPIELSGVVATGSQGFPAESDAPLRGIPIVRHASGLSRSLRNNAVYDREFDWVLSVNDQPRTRTRIVPTDSSSDRLRFALESRGNEIVLRFRPRFYQRHRGLLYFEPWTYQVWKDPIVGWCSWFAFFDRVTETDMRRTTDVLAESLAPFGFEYVQMDDGYQRDVGAPEYWLNANEKFPSGLAALASYIRGKGLKPGIWTNAAFAQADVAEANTPWFVLDERGRPARGNWINLIVDASVPAAVDTLVRPIYRGLRSQGWDYFKLDALRHLRYEGYNAHAAHFARKGVARVEAFRSYVRAVREEVGRDKFLLACWGIRPELVGLVDGCRLGTDGFSFAGLAQYNSFNNVVWRNDPDHIELSDQEAWRSSMVTSLTGSMFLLTDKPERYATPFAEPARRAAPVLMTRPGQLYDVDPSRSAALAQADTEVSGRDPKPFDAGLEPAAHLYALEINRPFESWLVLGRTGGEFERIPFDELGLDASKEYLVFEFWEKRFHGSFAGSFVPGKIPGRFNSQVFILRERVHRPQLVATSRHITGGGVDLTDVAWRDGVLSGTSTGVAGDPYDLYVTVPPGYAFSTASCGGAAPAQVTPSPGLVTVSCRPTAGERFAWEVAFTTGDGR